MNARSEITVPDGRKVGVHVLTEGDNDRTVVFCHAAPGSGAFDPDPGQTASRGITLIGVDRPGYGTSDRPDATWATVSGAADDVAEVVRQLDLPAPVGVAGWSAGGRVALAFAARHPDLVDRVVVIATPAPDEEVPWVPEEQRQGLEMLRGQPAAAVHEALGGQLAEMVPPDPRQATALVASGDADAALLDDPAFADRLGGMLEIGFAQGSAGIAADIAGYCLQPWGFEPGQVKAKTLLLYGARDEAVGPRHGKWYKARVPDSRFEQVPDAGHLVVLPAWSRALAFLAPRLKRVT